MTRNGAGPSDEGEVVSERTLEGDRSLLTRFRDGEQGALAEVFKMYVDDVTRTLRAGVRLRIDGAPTRLPGVASDFELENLIQETFVRAFAPAARLAYDGIRPYGAYLGTIARNLLVDRARKARRDSKRLVHIDDVEARTASDVPDPSLVLEEGQLRAVLRDFKGSLDDEGRRLFEVRYERSLGLRDAARELGLGLFKVRRMDVRLRQDLLTTLRAAGFVEHARVRIGTSVIDRGALKSSDDGGKQ